ncbi:hypothetical protein JCM33774_48620 [Actinophytocola sp. KF-1]
MAGTTTQQQSLPTQPRARPAAIPETSPSGEEARPAGRPPARRPVRQDALRRGRPSGEDKPRTGTTPEAPRYTTSSGFAVSAAAGCLSAGFGCRRLRGHGRERFGFDRFVGGLLGGRWLKGAFRTGTAF